MEQKQDYNQIFKQKRADVRRLLLHVCCAPCLANALDKIRGMNTTFLFYNPNILPKSEWQKRLEALQILVENMKNGNLGKGFENIELVVPEQNAKQFFEAIKGKENLGEGSARCTNCMKERIAFAAQFAKQNGFSHFATTLTSSPHKNAEQINAWGKEIDEDMYLPSDFKKENGAKQSKEICQKFGIYRQTYCGCGLDVGQLLSEPFFIGNVRIDGRMILAPMAGYTDVGFRHVAKQCGAALTTTEMVSAKALVFNNEATKLLLETTSVESPIAVQLFGSDSEALANAAKKPELEKFDIIDINMGCPMPKIVKNGEGSALMANPLLAEQIIRSVVAATSKPVTVKFRKGISSETAVEFAKMCQRAGASAITIHGRTKEQMYGGKCDYDTIKRVVEAVDIPVIASGDVLSRKDAIRVLQQTGATAVMVGRGAIGNPSIFGKEILAKQAIKTQIEINSRVLGERTAMLDIKKHLACYFKGQRNAAAIREMIMEAKTKDQLLEMLDQI